MASLAAEEKVEFLLQVLATSSDFTPDFGAIAKKTGINTNSNAQRMLKSIVEAEKRFVLQSQKGGQTKVIDTADGGETGTSTPVRTSKPRKRTKNNEDGGEEERGTPSKKGRKSNDEGAEEDLEVDAVKGNGEHAV